MRQIYQIKSNDDLNVVWGGVIENAHYDFISHKYCFDILVLDKGAEFRYQINCIDVIEHRYTAPNVLEKWNYINIEAAEFEKVDPFDVISFELWNTELQVKCCKVELHVI